MTRVTRVRLKVMWNAWRASSVGWANVLSAQRVRLDRAKPRSEPFVGRARSHRVVFFFLWKYLSDHPGVSRSICPQRLTATVSSVAIAAALPSKTVHHPKI